MQSLVSILQNRATRVPSAPAGLFLEDGQHESEKITFGELDKNARKIAAFLQSKQLSGQRILLLYPAGLEFISAFLGCLYAGVTAVPLSAAKQQDFDKASQLFQTIAVDARIAGIFAPDVLQPLAQHIIQQNAALANVFCVNPLTLETRWVKQYQTPDITADTLAYLQYTSGSTSAPKAAMITHKNLNQTLKQTTKAFGYTRKSITLTWAPHSHVYGLVCGILVPLYHGSLSILMPVEAFVRRPLSWLEAISHYKVTQSGCPNFGYDLCVRDIKDSDLALLQLGSWKYAINGGEAVQLTTLQNFARKFAACGFKLASCYPAFGMSEVTGAIAVTPSGKAPSQVTIAADSLKKNQVVLRQEGPQTRTVVSNGIVLPGLTAAIVDPDTLLPMKNHGIGEVWLAGDAVVAGYWQREEETRAAFGVQLPGSDLTYFRTGDLGFLHNEHLYLTGRLKEVIVVYGEKYYPLDIENIVGTALTTYTVLPTRAAFACTVAGKEQIVIAQEIPAGLTESTQQAIAKTIRQAITRHFGLEVHAVCLVREKSIPKTASGKLQRKVCQRQFLENTLSVLHHSGKSQPVVETTLTPDEQKRDFIKLIANMLSIPEKDIDLNTPVDEYGFDSINLVKLSGLLSETYQLDITPATFFEYNTLADFYRDYFQTTAAPVKATAAPAPTPNAADDDIAIIGLSCRFPGAANATEFWHNLATGKDCITEVPRERWDYTQYQQDPQLQPDQVKWGGFMAGVSEFDAHFFHISPREAELVDPQQRLFLQETWNAVEDAGYTTAALATIKTGIFVGIFTSDYAEVLAQHGVTDAYLATSISQSTLANRVSYQLNLTGPSEAINTACSSSLVALHNAMNAIHRGDCDVAVVGGVNTLLTPTLYLSAAKAGMLSPDGRCKAFDASANGYVRSEGIAAILIKPLTQALADHDHIYAVIKASAVNHGGHVNSLTVPNPNAQAELIATTYERAQVDIETITYIEAHGTGTPLGDPIEINGLKKAFALRQQQQQKTTLPSGYCGVGSVKSNIGHAEAAAGIAGIIKVILAMKHQQLPASLHYQALNPYIDLAQSPFYIVNQTKPWEALEDLQGQPLPRRAGVSSFGFGGTNAHVLLEEYLAPAASHDTLNKPYLFSVSAKTDTALRQRMTELLQWLQARDTVPSLSALSYTLNVGRNHFAKRCLLVATTVAELTQTLERLLAGDAVENGIINLDTHHKEQVAPLYREVFATLLQAVQSPALTPLQLRNKLLAIGNFYVQGYDLDWEALHQGPKQRLSLPTYPFAKEHFWVSAASAITAPTLAATNLLQAVQNDLIQRIAHTAKMDAGKIRLDYTLSELGFDSITFKELAVQLEKHYQIELTPSIFFTYPTTQALSQYLVDQHGHEITDKTGLTPAPVIRVPEALSTASEPVAIIGMQGMFPQSVNVDALWEHLLSGQDLITEIPGDRWNWRDYYTEGKNVPSKANSKWGGFIPAVDTFDASFFNISSREANFMDPQQRLFMEIVWRAIEDAGYDPHAWSGQRVGLFAGMEFNEYQVMLQSREKMTQGYVFSGNSHALLTNRVSYFLNFRGPSEVIDATCASSLIALNRAVRSLRDGESEIAIAGGVSLILNPDTYVITSQLNVLSPDGHCKTFDKSANGYVKGEGVAALVLKPLSKALRDHDHIYAVIKGSAENHGGKAQSLTAPNVNAQRDLLIQAYSQANISADTVSYIEAHGTGTELGDPIEIDALTQAFKALSTKAHFATPHCALGSIKTQIGHTEPASGMAGVIKVLLAMKHQELPGMLHFRELNPYIKLQETPFYVAHQRQPWTRLTDEKGQTIPRRAGVSSFGVGGSNAHVVLEEMEQPVAVAATAPQLITLSARHKDSLQQKIQDLHQWINRQNTDLDLTALSYTLNCGRTPFEIRTAFIVSSVAELRDSLQALMNGKTLPDNPAHPASLRAAKDAYLQQQIPAWDTLYAAQTVRRLAGLPSYPFIKKRYWFDEELKFAQPAAAMQTTPAAVVPPAVVPATTTADNIIPHLQSVFGEILRVPADEIDPDTTYEVYGVDSMIGLEIIERLEKDYGTLPKTLLYERNQLQDLAAYLKNKTRVTTTPTTIAAAPTTVSDDHDVAIIGLNGAFPLSADLEALWDNLVARRDCITEVPADRWDYKDYPVEVGGKTKYFRLGGFLPDVDKFDPLFFSIAPYDAAIMDPQERLFMQTTWATLEDAGYTRDSLQRLAENDVGVFAGVTYNYYPLYIAEEKAKGNVFPLDIQLFSVANRVSYFLNLKGPSFIVDTACSSSLAAIHLAYESVRRGECKMAIAGGVNLSLHPAKYHMLGAYSFLSDQGRCASFAAGGSGYVPSEGVATIILKPLQQAIKDNDRIYGVIKASQMNHGGKTSGYSVPNPNAQAELIKKTLVTANIDPRTISYIETHGTGTSLGDPIEVRGLQEAFEAFTSDKQFCAIGSIKSNIGHLESAAGVSQIAKVLLQMQHKKLVPSIHAEELNPFIDFANSPFFVQRELTDWQPAHGAPRRAGVSSFGAGGTNIHMIIEEYIPASAPPAATTTAPYVYLLSALNAEQLQEYVQKTLQYLQQHQRTRAADNHWLRAACYTSQLGRESMTQRRAFIISSYDDLVAQLTLCQSQPDTANAHCLLGKATAGKKGDSNDTQTCLQQGALDKLAAAWVNGSKIAWETLYAGQTVQKVFIPTYPFAKRRCWIASEPKATTVSTPATTPLITEKPADNSVPDYLVEWLYKSSWQTKALNTAETTANTGHWIIFSDNELGIRLQDSLGREQCSYCFEGDGTSQSGYPDNTYFIQPENPADYATAIEQILAQHRTTLKGIIYLWDIDKTMQGDDLQQLVEASKTQEASYKLLYLCQALIKQNLQAKLRFCLVSRSSQSVLADNPINIWQFHLWSLARVFGTEQPNYQVQLLDLDANRQLQHDADIISQEICSPLHHEQAMAYRAQTRYVNRLSLYLDDSKKAEKPFVAPEAALVTGGLGALGYEVVKWLAGKGTRYLLLTGNTVLPERATWSTVHETAMKERIDSILAIEKAGVQVIYTAADVTNKAAMQAAVQHAETTWQQRIQGVFHLAGITTDSITIDKLSRDLFQQVLAVKVQGSLVLHDIFQQSALTCFVMFSSIAAVPYFGMSGLSAYAMANAFLDGFAAFRRRQGLPATSIEWAAWAEKGMSFRYNHSAFLDAIGMSSIAIKTGIDILDQIVTLNPENVGVFYILWSKFLQVNPEARKLPFFELFHKHYAAATQPTATTHLSQEEIGTLLAGLLGELLGLQPNEIDLDAPYQNYGLDSIIGVNFVGKIGVHFSDVVSPMDLYRYPSVTQLAAFIHESCHVSADTVAPVATAAPAPEAVTDISHLSTDEVSQMLEDELNELTRYL